MKVLLDTHTVLWFWWDDPQLSPAAKTMIEDPSVHKYVSLAVPWEVAIKVSLKKLDLGGPYQGFFWQHMQRTYFDYLGFREEHFEGLLDLPKHHGDPFDRMMISQSLRESMPIVSNDVKFDAYGVTRIWNRTEQV